MKSFLTSIVILSSILLFSSVHAADQAYKPGFTLGFNSGGFASVGYYFGKDNSNLISLAASYRSRAVEQPTATTDDADTIPVIAAYKHYLQVLPNLMGNKLFWSLGAGYGKVYGSYTSSGKKYNKDVWETAATTGLEYRLTSNLALSAAVNLYSYVYEKRKDTDTIIKYSNSITDARLTLAYLF